MAESIATQPGESQGATREEEASLSKAASKNSNREMLDVLQQFRIVFGSQKRHYRFVEKSCGVGGAQLWALQEISALPGVTVGELAEKMAIHRSTATNMVNRLVEIALVEKQRTGDDQRIVQLALSKKGAAVIRKAPSPAVGVLQQALLDLPPATLASLRRDLERLIHSMKSMDPSAGSVPLADL